ncbi:MAG: tetratricopeptide repeat protein [Planctomycetota bacterium]|nr:tetratricopeptide repeat protein [Planctomycetota bacterium]
MPMPRIVLLLAMAGTWALPPGVLAAAKPNTLEQALSKLKIPPDWIATTQTSWDVAKPWKEGRLEIRRLLGLGTQDGNRQAIKLTWLYYNKKDIGDGHELPLYLLLGAEFDWAVKAHEAYLAEQAALGKQPLYVYKSLATCYMHYGAYDKAFQTLQSALQVAAKQSPQERGILEPELHSRLGDLYLEQGRTADARKSFAEAARLFPLAKPKYGGHLLHRHAAKVQAKLDLLDARALATATLKDGTYTGSAQGYTGPLDATVVVKGGKIADLKLKHTEKIDNNATVILPAKIIEKQSLQVDNITAATVTTDAIVASTLEALRKAGL